MKTAAGNPSSSKEGEMGMTGSNFRGTSRDLKPSQSIKIIPGSTNPLSGVELNAEGNLKRDKNNYMLN